MPGFVHDVCSAIHPLGVASPFFRTLPLAEHGVRQAVVERRVHHHAHADVIHLLHKGRELVQRGRAGIVRADDEHDIVDAGADVVGVFNVYANSPQGLYWLKSSGIKSIKDFPGRSIGNPPGDAARESGDSAHAAQERYLCALSAGLLKILSKMGISTLRSYQGAPLFEALGRVVASV